MRSELTLCESTNSCGLNVAVKSMCSHVLICFDIGNGIYTRRGAKPDGEREVYIRNKHAHGPWATVSFVVCFSCGSVDLETGEKRRKNSMIGGEETSSLNNTSITYLEIGV